MMRIDSGVSRKGSSLELPESAVMLHAIVKQDYLDLSSEATRKLQLILPDLPGIESATLTIDAYLFSNPTHPHGHFGWWTFAWQTNTEIELTFEATDRGLSLTGDAGAVLDSWINDGNPDPTGQEDILLHVVLRHRFNNKILSQQSLIAYRSGEAAGAARARAAGYLPPWNTAVALDFNWPRKRAVHVVTQMLPELDRHSETPAPLAIVRQLQAQGIACHLYASEFDPHLRGVVSDTRYLLNRATAGDFVLVLYHGREFNLSWLSRLRCRKAFIHLGVPSSDRMQAFDAESHNNAQVALQQAVRAEAFNAVAAASQQAANELTQVLAVAQQTSAAKLAQEPTAKPIRKPAPKVVRVSLFDRRLFWDGIQAVTEFERPSERLLVYPGRLEAYNDFVATLDVFAHAAEIDPTLHLVAVGSRAGRVYHQYIDHLLATRYQSVRARVHLRTEIGDPERKAFLAAAEALIDIGPSWEQPLDDARAFGKVLFVGGRDGARQEGSFRLYGRPDDQAAGLMQALNAGVAPAPARDGAEPYTLWNLLERLVAAPAPTGEAVIALPSGGT